MAAPNPLTPAHLEQINAALNRLREAEQLLARCERANMTVEGPKGDCQFLRGQLEAIKNEFFGQRAND